jgi:NTE family protein
VSDDALVLSGAGTKGAFEVGALRYLVDESAFAPSIICATSAGAIIGTVLAQARGLHELRDRVDELQQDLLAMTRTDVVFAKQDWLAEFDGTPVGDAIDAFLTVRSRPPIAPDPIAPEISDALADRRQDRAQRRRHRRWHDFMGVMSALPAARRAKKELPEGRSSMLDLGPLEDALRGRQDGGIRPIDPELVRRPGLQLRLAVTALQAGVTRYVTESGELVEAEATTRVSPAPDAGIDVIDGLLMSSSVPMVFEPRRVGDEVYVDGGVRQNIPVEAALRLGAARLVAVLGVPLAAQPVDADYSAESFVSVHLRSNALMFNEVQCANLNVQRPPDVTLTVIEPTVDVVGPFEVAQGLMLLDMDYGWMRAAEATSDIDEDRRRSAMQLSDSATAARERAWYLEEELLSGSAPSDEALDRLRFTKREVEQAIRERAALGLPTPNESQGWWLGYEQHQSAGSGQLPADLWASAGGFTPA